VIATALVVAAAAGQGVPAKRAFSRRLLGSLHPILKVERGAPIQARPGQEGLHLPHKEFNVLALIKGEERYVYVYDDVSRQALIEAFHAQAADAELTLNWFDAAVLTQKAEEQAAGVAASSAQTRF
jgi:hypothetical protein